MTEQALKPGWQMYRFDQIAINVNERVEPGDTDAEYYVGLEHLDSDSLKIRRWGEPSDVEATKLRFKTGDIIFGRRRVYQRKLAVAEFDGICSAHAMVLRPKTEVVLPEFLPFFMQSDMFMNRALEISVGSLSPTINWRTLAQQEFPLPPLAEQRRLAEVLWAVEEFSDELEQLLDKTRKLSQSWSIDQVDRFIRSGIRQEELESLCHKIVDGAHRTPTYVTEGIPFLRVTDINSDFIDWSGVKRIPLSEHEELVKRCNPEYGDVLLSKNGTIGLVRVVDWREEFSVFVSLCVLKPKNEVKPEFLAAMLETPHSMRQLLVRIKQGTVKNLHLEEIRKCSIPVPNMEEQTIFLDARANLENAVNETLTRLQSLKEVKNKLLVQGCQNDSQPRRRNANAGGPTP